eukprot:5349490-Karenia_brevis.AAC.1
MVLDPSYREFAIAELCNNKYGQFGPRVHLLPNSEIGEEFMRRDDHSGWYKAPHSENGTAWGRGSSSQSRGPLSVQAN